MVDISVCDVGAVWNDGVHFDFGARIGNSAPAETGAAGRAYGPVFAVRIDLPIG